MRLVSLCPSNTDLVIALGKETFLVGVDRWSLRDQALAQRLSEKTEGVVDVGTDLRVDIDVIASLRPDLVLASLSVPGMEANIEALERHKLPYIIVAGHTLAGVRKGIAQVAEAIDAVEQGRTLLAAFDARIDAVRAKVSKARAEQLAPGESSPGDEPPGPTRPPLRAVWEWWPNPVIVAGGKGWIADFFEILQVENAFADLAKESSPVETGEVPRRAPDVICACWCGTLEPRMTVERIARRPGWSQVPAVSAQRIFLLPEKLFGRPGPHLAAGLEELYEFFYGDRKAAAGRMAQAARLGPGALEFPAATH